MATITKIKNIFQPIDDTNRVIIHPHAGLSLAMYMHGDYVALKDGERLESTYIIQEGDNITIAPILRGGDDTGKAVLSVIAVIVLAVVANVAGGAVAGALVEAGTLGATAAGAVGAVVTGAIMVAGSMLINHYLGPQIESPELNGEKSSPTYSWTGATTTSNVGLPIPILYGTMRLPGNIINRQIDYIDGAEYLKLQLALCNGIVKPISENNVLVNGTNFLEYKTGEYPEAVAAGKFDFTNGALDQPVTQLFDSINSATNVAITLNDGESNVRVPTGQGFNSLEVVLKAPQGLYFVDSDDGSINRDAAYVKVEYRETDTYVDPEAGWVTIDDRVTVDGAVEYHLRWSSGLGYDADTLEPAFYYYYGGTTSYEEQTTITTDPNYIPENINTYLQHTTPETAIEVATGVFRYYPDAYLELYQTVQGEDSVTLENSDYVVYYKDFYPGYIQMVGDGTKAVSRNVRFSVDPSKNYEIRCTKAASFIGNPDTRVDTVAWSHINGRVTERLNYPGVATISLNLKATDQLSGGTPNIHTLVTKAGIPIYDETGTYQFDGPSNNPAWAAWDLLTNPIYGGGLSYSQVDFQSFWDWAVWCGEVVDNGQGVFIPRAEFNGVFDYNTNLWEAVSKITSVGRAALVIRGTKYGVIVDNPALPVQTFTMGNIIAGSYSTTYTPLEDLSTEVEIQFINKEKDYTQDQFTVRFSDGEEVGKKTTLQAFGITSVAEAYRWGKYLLNTSNYQRRHITFDADIDSIACSAGDVINFSHDVPRWGDSGRIVAIDPDTNTITLDKKITTSDAKVYSIMIRFSDDSIETIDVTNPGTGDFDTFVVPNMVRIPQVYDVYSFGEQNNYVKPFRIISITRSSEQQRTITAVEYNESIIDDDTTVTPALTPYTPIGFPEVTNVTINEHLEKRADGTIIPYIDLTWETTEDEGAKVDVYISDDFLVGFKKIASDVSTQHFAYNALDIVEGKEYYFKFQPRNSVGTAKALVNLPYTAFTYLGKSIPPADATGFTMVRTKDGIQYNWTANTDVDLAGYEIRVNSEVVVTNLSATSYLQNTTLSPGTYNAELYAIDTSGNYSAIPATAQLVITLPATLTGATATRIKDGIFFTWDEDTSIDFKEYELRQLGTKIVGGLTSNEYTYITPLVADSYSFEVHSKNTSGDYSLAAHMPITISPPAAVTGLVATRVEDGISMEWDAHTDINFSYFEIHVGLDVIVTSLSSTTYRYAAPLAPGDYTVAIYAVDTSGNYSSVSSQIVTVNPPEDVLNFNVTLEADGLLLTWDNVFNTYATYNLYVNGNPLVRRLKANKYKFSEARTLSTYNFAIEAENTFGDVSATQATTQYVENGPPQVTGFSYSFEADGILLKWQASTYLNHSAYEITTGGASLVTDLKATTYKIAKNLPFGDYSFEIKAIDKFGNKSATASTLNLTVEPPAQPGATYEINGTDLETTMVFNQGSFPFDHFRIVYDTVDVAIGSSYYTVPIYWSGVKEGTIYGVDSMGNQSAGITLFVNIVAPTMDFVLPEVIDNNVLLRWEGIKGTLPIVEYNVYKGDVFTTAELIGTNTGSFSVIFESERNVYTYWVEPVDSAGNLGTPKSVAATVNQPPDYILNLHHVSTGTGTLTNGIVDEFTGALIPVKSTDTYQQHFTNYSWTSAQDQVTAGYVYWIAPFLATGSYEETIDIGTLLGASTVSLTDTIDILASGVSYVLTVSLSDDGITWLDYTDTRRIFGTNFRYVKVRYDVSSTTFGFLRLRSLEVRVDSKLINDAGSGTIPANSTTGYEVFFNIPFIDVSSISLSAGGSTPVILLYDFADVPNPTSFKVYAYDTSGTIMTTPVDFSWAVKGY